MDWKEVKITTTTLGIEPLTAALMDLGITGFKIEDAADFTDFVENNDSYYDCIDDEVMKLSDCESSVTIYVKEDEQGAELLLAVRDTLLALSKEYPADFIGTLEMDTEQVFEEDWANAWKKYFKPVKITDRLTVKPTWEEYSPTEGEIVLEIDPGMAFGTGTHESTNMCLTLLDEYIKGGEEMLDVGCGSGILSIAGSKLGAKSVLSVDNDSMCVKVTNENIIENGCTNIEAVCGDLTDKAGGKKYDVIVANIVADVIVRLNDSVGELLEDDGVYICSGIIDAKEAMVVESLREHGFEPEKIICKKDWRAIASRKVK